MALGGILTAMVTPFGPGGELNEERAVALMHHLLENGSDGVVLAATTGESATLTDEEMVRLWELGVAECGGAPVIAGTVRTISPIVACGPSSLIPRAMRPWARPSSWVETPPRWRSASCWW